MTKAIVTDYDGEIEIEDVRLVVHFSQYDDGEAYVQVDPAQQRDYDTDYHTVATIQVGEWTHSDQPIEVEITAAMVEEARLHIGQFNEWYDNRNNETE